jgi:hypothetical protein
MPVIAQFERQGSRKICWPPFQAVRKCSWLSRRWQILHGSGLPCGARSSRHLLRRQNRATGIASACSSRPRAVIGNAASRDECSRMGLEGGGFSSSSSSKANSASSRCMRFRRAASVKLTRATPPARLQRLRQWRISAGRCISIQPEGGFPLHRSAVQVVVICSASQATAACPDSRREILRNL